MATPAAQLDAITAMTFEKIKPVLTDQITNETILLAMLNLKSQVTEDGGRELQRPLMYALNNTVRSYSGYDPIDTTPQGGFGYATYNWRDFAGSVTISGDEVRKNSGAAQVISLVQAKADQLRLSIEDVLNTMLFADGTGNSNKDLLGLKAIITNTGTLGGIDSSTETWWKAQVNANAVSLATNAGVKSLNNMFNTCLVARSKPDFELTTQANYESYEQLANSAIRYTQTRLADLGFEALAHKTAELSIDPDVTTNYWYFINSQHLEFVRHRDAWLTPTDWVRPANQDARSMLVISSGNLITDCRRAHGVMTNVS